MTTTNNNDDHQRKAEEGRTKRIFRILEKQISNPEEKLKHNLNLMKALFDRMGARNGSSLRSEQDRVKRETIEGMLALDLQHLKPGDQIYIPSDYHRNEPQWSLLGGLATVSDISDDLIRVEEDPHGRYLVHALRDQAVMKAVFCLQRARLWTDEDTKKVLDKQPVIPEDHPKRTWARKAYEAIFRKTGIGKKATDHPPISIHTLNKRPSSAQAKDQTSNNQD